jgi:hypothetical protein
VIGPGIRSVVMDRMTGKAGVKGGRQSADLQVGAALARRRRDSRHQRSANCVDPRVRRLTVCRKFTQRRQCRRDADQVRVVGARVVDAAAGKQLHDLSASGER